MQLQTQLQSNVRTKEITCNAVVVCKGKNTKLDFHSLILGKQMCSFVVDALCDYPTTTIDKYEDYFKIAKDHCGTFDYTIVIGGNMPLLSASNMQNLVQYAIFKNANLVKFTGGYFVKNSYLKNATNPMCDNVYTQDFEDFYLVENKTQLRQVTKIIQNRLIAKFDALGVEILGKVQIDYDAQIDGGAVIFGGNVIKGYSHISSGVILKENNVIEDSFVGNDSCISYSIITNSRIGKNCYIGPFAELNGVKLLDNQTVKGNKEK
ncbi:MAG: hypothetical protein IK070_02890 [Clostridia bacterium]|nr:hypothetical protein [Clostridia bacterium]